MRHRRRYRSRTLRKRQRPPSDARPGNQGVRRSPRHHSRPFPPRPSGPRIIASPVGFPDRRSLTGLRRKPLQALLGIKLNIWTLFPLCLLSFLLSPSEKKLKTKPESRRPSPTHGLKARRGNRKLPFSQCLAELCQRHIRSNRPWLSHLERIGAFLLVLLGSHRLSWHSWVFEEERKEDTLGEQGRPAVPWAVGAR